MTLTLANLLAALALAVVLAAELWHARRVRRLAPLAFGQDGPPPLWWLSVPLRAGGVAAAVWGACVLLALAPQRVGGDDTAAEKEADHRRLLVVLDVSPSMQLSDAGPARDATRGGRAGDVMLDLLRRISLQRCRASVVAFYTDAKPVAVDVTDLTVLENIFRDLPLDQAFEPGPSELFKGLAAAFDLAKDWPKGSTTLVVVTDGDVTPAVGMPQKPPSVGEVTVVGVGDAQRGTFIAGRQSRQDAPALRQVARRLGGTYYDCNLAPLPSNVLSRLGGGFVPKDDHAAGLREIALAGVAAGAAVVALVPIALAFLARLGRGFGNMRRRRAAFD